MSRIRIHALAAGLAVVGASLLAPVANAQGNWPQKEITLINNFPPGSATELTARAFARSIEKTLGKPVVIKAVPGSSARRSWPAARPTATRWAWWVPPRISPRRTWSTSPSNPGRPST